MSDRELLQMAAKAGALLASTSVGPDKGLSKASGRF